MSDLLTAENVLTALLGLSTLWLLAKLYAYDTDQQQKREKNR